MAEEQSNPPPPPTQAELLAISESLRAEVQRMVELMNQKQNSWHDGEKQKIPANDVDDDDDDYTAETKAAMIVTLKPLIKRTNPFSKEVMSFQMPKNFTLPMTLKPYEGTGDPNIYVTKFYLMMFMNGASDPILCCIFSTFLDGAALIWFSDLPASSISSFDELADLFVNNFVASKIYVHDSYLINHYFMVYFGLN
ncbi:uncharacterized protein DS421_16g554660 [Arachis hypogaea]|nr:uncharacterized protein DS421_16g554660 [Arachis hypogaea]